MARNTVGLPYAGAKTTGDQSQVLIAQLMTQAVIHIFELVDVDIEHRQRLIVFACLQCLIELLEEGIAVEQAGQRVVSGLELRYRLMQLALGDVLDGSFNQDKLPVIIADATAVFRYPDDGAVLAKGL